MHLPVSHKGPQHPEKQRLTMLIQTYNLTWILLFVSTLILFKWQIGVVYIISGWNGCVLLGAVFSLSGRAFSTQQGGIKTPSIVDRASERAPLMSPPKTPEQSQNTKTVKVVEAHDWWIVQLLIVVPLPITLFLHLLVLLVTSLGQTLSDGNNPILGELLCTLS
jgi:uncharacterized membrane protein YraQ (UPF0718 family)